MASTQRDDVRRLLRLLVTASLVVLGLALAPSGAAGGSDQAPESVGYLVERGRARTIAFPGAANTYSAGINDRGVIAGKYRDANGRDHGFVRTRWGRYRGFDFPGAASTTPYKINHRGQIVGAYNTQSPNNSQAGSKGFLLDNGRFITVHPPGAIYSRAEGINDVGIVVGEYQDSAGTVHGYRWHRGQFRTIDVPGTTGTVVSDINDHGDIVGIYLDTDDGPHAFIRRNHPHARFEHIDVPGDRYSLALGINNRRQVVGTAGNDLATASDAQGFLLTGGANGRFTPIEIRGTTRTVGFDINNRRQIVAGIFPAVPDHPPGTTQPMDATPRMPLTADGHATPTPADHSADASRQDRDHHR
jgi:uncharacterized membrane protein